MVTFWFLARYLSGGSMFNPIRVRGERIVEAGWFSQKDLPDGHVFPAILRGDFWHRARDGFPAPVNLAPVKSIF